jgi:hypothetical protein
MYGMVWYGMVWYGTIGDGTSPSFFGVSYGYVWGMYCIYHNVIVFFLHIE